MYQQTKFITPLLCNNTLTSGSAVHDPAGVASYSKTFVFEPVSGASTGGFFCAVALPDTNVKNTLVSFALNFNGEMDGEISLLARTVSLFDSDPAMSLPRSNAANMTPVPFDLTFDGDNTKSVVSTGAVLVPNLYPDVDRTQYMFLMLRGSSGAYDGFAQCTLSVYDSEHSFYQPTK